MLNIIRDMILEIIRRSSQRLLERMRSTMIEVTRYTRRYTLKRSRKIRGSRED